MPQENKENETWGKVVAGNQPSPTPSQPANLPSPVNFSSHKTLQVYADSTRGTPFINKENGYINVSFEATGEWLAIPENIINYLNLNTF